MLHFHFYHTLHFLKIAYVFLFFVVQHVSIDDGLTVQASFQQTMWNVGPVSSGGAKAQGYLTGSDVLRMFHGHMDDCLTVPPTEGKHHFMR